MSERIRNFCIIAHIDHGKSTLADRLLLRTGLISAREFREQFLDAMELERERGITIKAKPVRMVWKPEGTEYVFNLIDTPGHVDFAYEVSRSLTACEGAVLLVDAVQGVEAQTVAHAYHALEHGLEIIPVLNKIDLPTARPETVMEEIEQLLGISFEECLLCSAKHGKGVEEVMQAIVRRIPPPAGDSALPLRALVFDSEYDAHLGVVCSVRLFEGAVRLGEKIVLHHSGSEFEVIELGHFGPAGRRQRAEQLQAGEVGYLAAAIKDVAQAQIGDTVMSAKQTVRPLPGYQTPKPMVFCGLYPADNQDFESLRKALARLALNDSSFTCQPETSTALGFGFRCGFLGLLHMEIVQERLEREFNLTLVKTAPNVSYQLLLTDGQTLEVHCPSEVPDASRIKEFREPVMRCQFLLPPEYIGGLLQLCEDRRSTFVKQEHIGARRVIIEYDLPLAEIIFDFYDLLKSVTRGYGTMDYELKGLFPADLVRVDILIHGAPADAFSLICHRSVAPRRGRNLLIRLKREIPRHLFPIALQAAIGGRIIARETISALRKDVTAKCYGGDVTRKRKLLEKQKAGKRRMKTIGSVEVPQQAFLAVLQAREEE